MLKLDHIAVAGTTLEEATEAVETALGVVLQSGGRHEFFSTHNRLLRLADGLYLEVIAIDPAAPPPDRPRWFDLDRFSGRPRLTNWICQTGDMTAALKALPLAGTPVSLTRGDLRWQMAVPDTGALAYGGLHPALIEWQSPVHPSALLAEAGCALRRLTVTGPEALTLQDAMSPVFTDPRVMFERADVPQLVAEIDTPHGPRVLQ